MVAATAALDAARNTPGQISGKWVVAIYSASWPLLTASLAVAEQASASALAIGREAGIEESVPFQAYGGQLTCIRSLQGRLAELERAVRRLATTQTLSAAWHGVLARLHSVQGRSSEAKGPRSGSKGRCRRARGTISGARPC